ncbi:MAG: hypothetical protein WCR06_02375 [bacterium]
MTVCAWRHHLAIWLGSLWLCCAAWAVGLVICPKCGTEADEGLSACGHCGAMLPEAKAAAAPVVNPAVSLDKQLAMISELALDATRADIRLANESLGKRPELALAYYENALGLARLVKREGMAADAGKSLADSLERCRKMLTFASRACATCNGSGKRSVQFQSLTGVKGGNSSGLQVADGPTCTACAGRGTVSAGRSVDELRVLIAQGRRDFETRQQANGRVACGRVWTPPALPALLDVKAQALLRTACPTPCSGCMGVGQQDCTRCKGAGRLKCSNEGCADGWVVRKESNVLSSKLAISRKERCPGCQGTGFMPCVDCHGNGTIPCKNCSGTGHNAVCQECGGQGWTPCGKCQGTRGAGEAICAECRGQKERICPKCRGEGCQAK